MRSSSLWATLICVLSNFTDCFRVRIPQIRHFHSKCITKSGLVETPTTEPSIKSEITKILDSLLLIPDFSEVARNSTVPIIFTENSHILAHRNDYEAVINEKITTIGNATKLECVDGYLRPLIIAERQKRARMKLGMLLNKYTALLFLTFGMIFPDYLLAGAAARQLEHAIDLLSNRYIVIMIFGSQFMCSFSFVLLARRSMSTCWHALIAVSPRYSQSAVSQSVSVIVNTINIFLVDSTNWLYLLTDYFRSIHHSVEANSTSNPSRN